MGNTAVRVVGLGKQYHIGGRQKKNQSFREVIADTFMQPFRRARDVLRGQAARYGGNVETFWALKDLHFEVKHGEVIGIIGRNGAGKSTLLKILSRITEPTEGYADIYGRVGALLEVGTGFHLELTGRENIYLNGSILGMTRAEIDRKFDEIVAFAEIEQFIDTAVKHYSSGMGLRLGFAVAAHLEPEILIVDEVLAVGDVSFQQKCLNKMSDVASEGRTVLFVSHNMGAVQALCTRAILLQKGRMSMSGLPSEVISHYIEASATKWQSEPNDPKNDDVIVMHQVQVVQGDRTEYFDSSIPVQVQLHYEVTSPVKDVLLGLDILSSDGIQIFRTYDMGIHCLPTVDPGHYISTLTLPAKMFKSGSYMLEVLVGLHRIRWIRRNDIRIRLNFTAQDSDINLPGVILPAGHWEYIRTDIVREAL